jgi:hypothetical protein
MWQNPMAKMFHIKLILLHDFNVLLSNDILRGGTCIEPTCGGTALRLQSRLGMLKIWFKKKKIKIDELMEDRHPTIEVNLDESLETQDAMRLMLLNLRCFRKYCCS